MISSPWTWIDQEPTLPGNSNPRKVIETTPVATITRTPGHQAQKPAKKPQKAPNALLVQR